MTIKGNAYCLGYGLSDKCGTCQNEKNWLELNEMPHNWRKNAQSKMERVDESTCGLYGGVFYIPLYDLCSTDDGSNYAHPSTGDAKPIDGQI